MFYQFVKSPDVNMQANDDESHNPSNIEKVEEKVMKYKCKCKCKSKSSKCLKLYCNCFHRGQWCNERCTCVDCKNTTEHEQLRTETIGCILERNRNAFDEEDMGLRRQGLNDNNVAIILEKKQKVVNDGRCQCSKSK